MSVIDVVSYLADTSEPRRYWSDLKRKLTAEGSEVYEKIVQLKLRSPDGKLRETDCADTETMLRIVSQATQAPSAVTDRSPIQLSRAVSSVASVPSAVTL
jgi:hypothetical protein